MSRMICYTTVQPLSIPLARLMVPALLSLALLALTMLRPELALANAATGQLQIVNNTNTTVIVEVDGQLNRNVQAGNRTTYKFGFGSCNKTKNRDFSIKESLSGGGFSYLVGSSDGAPDQVALF